MEKRYVYLVLEEGSWDYETTNSFKVFDSFEKAMKDFKQRVKDTKVDMKNWIDEDETEIEETIENEHAYFSMYESGDYSRIHNTISLDKTEIE